MECDPPISILLIGSTGNGKSSLGNFLLDPSDEHIQRKKTFQTGTTNKPETKPLEYAYDRRRNPSLRVIDTPGLNEDIEEDRLHMGQVLQSVKELKSITACVFCIKFNSRIHVDAQYKKTIKYYKKLEPKLFERNVVIVLTNFKTDDCSVTMREFQGVNVDDVEFNIQRAIVKSAELSYYPKVFKIDSLPMSEEDRRTSESCRTSLLDYIKQKFRPLSILLIGSTGSGKSSLGNFLLDPPSDEHIKKAIFCTGRTSFPETQRVQYAYDRDVHPSLLVIDTPGLNESASKDLSHIIDLVKMLQELKAITACVFCIKFDSKIDAQFKDTVASYCRLLPSLFEGNVIIALTNFQTDERSVKMRDIQRVDVDAIVRNTQEEIVDSGNLKPPVFLIDSLPLSKEERMTSLSCRSSMLDYIKQCLRPICTKELQVPKTQLLKELDEKEIRQLDHEIKMYLYKLYDGCNMRLKEVNEKVKKVFDDIQQATKLRREIKSIKAKLHEKDSETMVTVKTWNVQVSCKRYRRPPPAESFEIKAECPIVDVTRWDNGHLTWKEFQCSKDTGCANGKVEGKWFRVLHATVNLLTEKRIKYKKDIETFKAVLPKKEEELEVSPFQDLEKKHQLKIDDFIERKERLLTDPISIEEADERLDEQKGSVEN